MRFLLTDQSVADAQCPAGKREIKVTDTRVPGFLLRVTAPTGNAPAGVRSFKYRYGHGGGGEVLLGRFPDITTAKARAKAVVLRGRVVDGRDPAAERRAAAADRNAQATANAYTVDTLIDDWTEHHLRDRSRAYRARVPREMRAALAEWRRVPAEKLQRQDVVRVLDRVKKGQGPVAANRLHAEGRACWGWAVKRGGLSANPWAEVQRPSREVARERVLLDGEMSELWRVSGELGDPWRGIVRLMMLTGQRRGEVAGMLWDELDLDAGTWTMPGARTKNGRTHIVPLAPPAVDLLRQVTRIRGQPLVFAGARQTVPSGFGKLKRRLDEALAGAAAESGRASEPWVLHDLRRTVATGLQRLGVRLEVTEALLNHVSGSRTGIVAVYQRYQWEAEKAGAAKAWAEHLLCGGTPAANVVRLAVAR